MGRLPKAGVITFPGSNCDSDLVYALGVSGFEVAPLWHKDKPDLAPFDLIALPGGFSYGDYLRCGAIASTAEICEPLLNYVERGKLLLGICNGFQILCEMRLLPGGLVRNRHMKFISTDVWLSVENTSSLWTRGASARAVWRLPIAHGDGRYVCDDKELGQLEARGQVLLRYCSPSGAVSEDSNPNGSVRNIAGISNTRGNVFGLMPHPERATDLKSRDGRQLWSSVLQSLRDL